MLCLAQFPYQGLGLCPQCEKSLATTLQCIALVRVRFLSLAQFFVVSFVLVFFLFFINTVLAGGVRTGN